MLVLSHDRPALKQSLNAYDKCKIGEGLIDIAILTTIVEFPNVIIPLIPSIIILKEPDIVVVLFNKL